MKKKLEVGLARKIENVEEGIARNKKRTFYMH